MQKFGERLVELLELSKSCSAGQVRLIAEEIAGHRTPGTSKNDLREVMRDISKWFQEGNDDNGRVLVAILDKIKGVKGDRFRFLAAILKWICATSPKGVAKALASDAMLGPQNKLDMDMKLEVVTFLSGALRQQRQKALANACLEENLPSIFLEMAKVHSQKTAANRYIMPTQLSIEAGDVAMTLLARLCILVREGRDSMHHCQLLWAFKDQVVIPYVALIIEWNMATAKTFTSDIYIAGLKDLKTSLQQTFANFSVSSAMALSAILDASFVGLIRNDSSIASKEDQKKELSVSLVELQRTVSQKSDTLDEYVCNMVYGIQIRRICFLLGRFGRKRVLELLQHDDNLLGQQMIQLLGQQMTKQNPLTAQLLALCVELYLGKNESEDSVAAYQPLLKMLQQTEKDTIAQCATDLLAQGAAKYQGQLIPELIGLLASLNAAISTKVNVLAVLQRFLEITNGIVEEDYCQVFIDRVIDATESETFQIREPASKLLGSFDPRLVLPYLLSSLIDKEKTQMSPHTRTVRMSAVSLVFKYHRDTLEVFEIYFQFLLQQQQHNDVLVDLAKKWATTVSEHVWPSLIRSLIQTYLEQCPGNHSVVALLRRLATPYIVTKGGSVLEEVVFGKMETDPELSEEIINGPKETMNELLLQRVAPLLILRMLDGFHFPLETQSRVGTLLLRRVLAIYEFPEVQQLSLECFVRLLPQEEVVLPCLEALLGSCFGKTIHVDLLQQTLKSFQGTENEALYPGTGKIAKLSLLGICHGFSQKTGNVLPRSLFLLILDITGFPAENETCELYDIQQGCVEVMKLAILHSPDSLDVGNQKQEALVAEVLPQQQDEPNQALRTGFPFLKEIIAKLEQPAVDASVWPQRICIVNAIVKAVRTVGELSSKGAAEVESLANGLLAETLLGRILGILQIHGLNKSMDTNNSSHARFLASCFQLLFNICWFREKITDRLPTLSSTNAAKLGSVTLAGLSDQKEFLVRLESIKLAGALLCFPEEVTFPDGVMAQVVTKLKGIANMDSSLQARKLAETMLSATT